MYYGYWMGSSEKTTFVIRSPMGVTVIEAEGDKVSLSGGQNESEEFAPSTKITGADWAEVNFALWLLSQPGSEVLARSYIEGLREVLHKRED